MAMRVEVIRQQPGPDRWPGAAEWVVLAEAKVIKSAVVQNDPTGANAANQGRLYVKMAIEAGGGEVDLDSIPVVISDRVA